MRIRRRTSPGSTTTCSAARTTSPPTARRRRRAPSGAPGRQALVRAQRAVLRRAVRYLVAEAGCGSWSTSAPDCPRPTTCTRSPTGRPRRPGSSTSTTTRWCSPTPGRCSPNKPGRTHRGQGGPAGSRRPCWPTGRSGPTLDFERPVGLACSAVCCTTSSTRRSRPGWSRRLSGPRLPLGRLRSSSTHLDLRGLGPRRRRGRGRAAAERGPGGQFPHPGRGGAPSSTGWTWWTPGW